MKPRNKYEQRVAELNATLSEDIAVRDIEWVKKQDYGYRIDGRKDVSFYFTLVTRLEEFQVKRLYRCYKFPDKHYVHYFFVEIMREFKDGGITLYFGKKKTMGCYFDCFAFGSDMELRENYRNYAGNAIADLFPMTWGEHPQSRGKRVHCDRIDPKELARIICNNPVAETMYKQRDKLFPYLLYASRNKEVCRALVIAKRHGYAVNEHNAGIWFDMVRDIAYCKYDYHNPFYICPADIHATHDRFMKMKIRKKQEEETIRKNRKAEEKAKLALDYQKMYENRRKRFFDMVLKKGSLSITPLRNIEEFKECAEYFHNCVFSNEYWNMKTHSHSLILVACVGGFKAELMEIDLNNYTIRQCFGKHNQFSNYHDKIVRYVKRHMNTIKEYNENNVQLKKAA